MLLLHTINNTNRKVYIARCIVIRMIDSIKELEMIKSNDSHLEHERAKFLSVCSNFIDDTMSDSPYLEGRPKFPIKDILKALSIQTLNGLSFRRAESDLLLAKTLGCLNTIPKKSTLSKYMNDKSLTEELERLIQLCAIPFFGSEEKLIVDSTWFAIKMYSGGHNRKPKYGKPDDQANIPSMEKCKKLHIACLPNSKIIAYAKATSGTTHDCPLFNEIISTVYDNGFIPDKCLADAGYLSKDNYALCQELGIKQSFIDFKSNITGKHPKSQAFRDAFHLYKHEHNIWHEDYRYRVLIESVNSVIKRKFLTWLRTKTDTARDNEILLKALCYNLLILTRYS